MTAKSDKKSKKTKEVESSDKSVDITQDADVFLESEIQKHLDDLKKSGKKYKTICKLF
jgi:hypothetical protein